MYSKKYRLPIGQDMKAAKKIFSSPYFLVKSKDNDCGHNRFGIIISSAAVKKSTERHFWKRRIADYLRKLPNLKKDFLVIVTPEVQKILPETLNNELNKFLEKILPCRQESK